MKSSYVIAGVVAIAAVGWVLSGQVTDPKRSAHAIGSEGGSNGEEMSAVAPQRYKRVRVRSIEAQSWRQEVIIRGRTEASRSVKLRAETAGRIAKIMVDEGKGVTRGQTLVRLDPAERTAALAEAKALLHQRTVEYKAARALAAKGYRAGTKLAEAQAQLDAARARVSQMKTDMARTIVGAPFDGILEKRYVELGDYLKIGDDLATIVDLDPILVVGAISERDVGSIKIGLEATATLVDGRSLTGIIRFIGAVADATTRTFRVEFVIPNQDQSVRDGITSQVRLFAAELRAHFLPPALLTLDENGRLGVKAVDASDRVIFHPVKILADRTDGIWVKGLPERLTLITVGQEFVRTGQRVKPVAETRDSAS
jgi:multidrug efflux system membrane fusion protein